MTVSSIRVYNSWLASLCRFEVLPAEEERRLFDRLAQLQRDGLRSEALATRNRLVESNLRLVVSLARRFVAPDRSLEDLVSAAALPLIGCVDRFDAARGTRFSTYATRALLNFFGRLCRVEQRRKGAFPCSERIGDVACGEPDDPLRQLIRAEDLRGLRGWLARLPRRERNLVVGRFGLAGDGRPRSFRELGTIHGLSKERVRVITAEVLGRLQESMRDAQRSPVNRAV